MFLYTTLIGAFVFGIMAGTLRLLFTSAFWIVAGLAGLAYLALLAVAGGWAVQCWDCTYGSENTRGYVFSAWAIYGGALATTITGGAFVGSRLVRRLAR